MAKYKRTAYNEFMNGLPPEVRNNPEAANTAWREYKMELYEKERQETLAIEEAKRKVVAEREVEAQKRLAELEEEEKARRTAEKAKTEEMKKRYEDKKWKEKSEAKLASKKKTRRIVISIAIMNLLLGIGAPATVIWACSNRTINIAPKGKVLHNPKTGEIEIVEIPQEGTEIKIPGIEETYTIMPQNSASRKLYEKINGEKDADASSAVIIPPGKSIIPLHSRNER
jgi:hypothetical protein